MIDGFFVVDKPAGMTSHDVVARLRRIVGQRRVGHSGTLDPGATGVLCIAVGAATRLIRFLDSHEKQYMGELVLGAATTTLDDEGEVTATYDMHAISHADVRRVAATFEGHIQQVPPMVSAVKIGGKRLHQLAREGIEVERKPRDVEISSIDIANTLYPNVYNINVICSTGTYIRTLCADIGERLGGGAHLRALRRTRIGPFSVEEAATLTQLESDFLTAMQSPAQMVRGLPVINATPEMQAHIHVGRKLDLQTERSGAHALVDSGGSLLAVYESDGKALRPAVVLAAAGDK